MDLSASPVALLHFAVRDDDLGKVKSLLLAQKAAAGGGRRRDSNSERKYTVHDRDWCGRTPLHFACSEEMCRFLLKLGARLDAVEDEYGQTPLHYAVQRDLAAVVRVYLEQGVDPNQRDKNNQTAIHMLAGNLEVARNLLQYGAQVEAETNHGERAIHFAASANNLPLVRLLTEEAHADWLARNHMGKTILHLLAEQGHVDLLKYLLQQYSELVIKHINAGDAAGWTPLQYACLGSWPQYQSYTQVIEVLIQEAQANVDARDHNGWCPLHCCTDSRAARLLIEAGAAVDVRDIDSRTPLHFASPEVTVELVRAGADVNALDRYGRSPLHLTTSPDKTRVLIANGADLNAVDDENKTPLDWAILTEREEVAAVLVSAGARTFVDWLWDPDYLIGDGL